MRKPRHQEVHAAVEMRLWKYEEAAKAAPYLRSVVGSIREHRLESQRLRLQMRRISSQPGRPDRHALIRLAEATRDAERAESRLGEAIDELEMLDVCCLDPVSGLALIPFRQGDQLAWFVFDLFAPKSLDSWRFQTDPLEGRRPISEVSEHEIVDARSADFVKGIDP